MGKGYEYVADPVKCPNCKESAWLEKEKGVLQGYRCHSCESFFPLKEDHEKVTKLFGFDFFPIKRTS